MDFVEFKMGLSNTLTVSYQYVRERVVFSTPAVDLYCPSERHHDHNEIEDHGTAPGHSQTLSRTTSVRRTDDDKAILTP